MVYREHWHKGVVGIYCLKTDPSIITGQRWCLHEVAILLPERPKRSGFNLYEAIYECREYLVAYGGHFAAAGLSLLPENVDAFARKFDEVVSNTIDEKLLIPEIIIDHAIQFSEISSSFYNTISRMEPFGPET